MTTVLKQDNDLTGEAFMAALIASLEPKFSNAFEELVRSLKLTFTLNQIEEIITAGNVNDLLDINPQLLNQFGNEFADAIRIAGVAAGIEITANTPPSIVVSFDQTNERAVQAMQQSKLNAITGFTQAQREATQEALAYGIQNGLNPKEQARMIRNSIGLTANQVRAVNNYRDLLIANSREVFNRKLRDRRFDRSIERAISTETALTTEQIDRMVERYTERYIKYRSEVIARTESLRSAHQGTEEMYFQAFQDGTLNAEDLVQTWVTASDERVRTSHSPMNNQKADIGEDFVSGQGARLRYPGDPSAPAQETVQCRCVKTVKFK